MHKYTFIDAVVAARKSHRVLELVNTQLGVKEVDISVISRKIYDQMMARISSAIFTDYEVIRLPTTSSLLSSPSLKN